MISRILTRHIQKSPKSVLLLGPRQTGKSTVISSLKPDLEINLAHELTFLDFSQNPLELEKQIAGCVAKRVFVDEIQRIPSLLNTIQVLLDQSKRNNEALQFYLTGSSARKLKRGQANLLPGRLFSYELGPIVAAEQNYSMKTKEILAYGSLPEPLLSRDSTFREKLLRTYTATYLKEEIQAEALTRNVQGFSRFLAVVAEKSGQYLDISKLATKAKVSRQSTVRFFEILEDTLLVHKLGEFPYATDADQVKHPRFFLFDTGVLNGILGNFIPSSDRMGFLFEHLVFNQVYYSARAQDKDPQFWNFRTRSGVEVDFIFEIDQKLWALEVKATSHISSEDVSGLEQFHKYCQKSYTPVIVVPEGVAKKQGRIWVLPWQKLLQEMGL